MTQCPYYVSMPLSYSLHLVYRSWCLSNRQLEKDVRADPQDLDALKFVLNTIADITASSMGMDIELGYLDVMERYRTLQQYSIPVPNDEMAKAQGMACRWQSLFNEAKTKDLCLVKVKERFREVTKEQAVQFHQEVKEMEVAFRRSGPGNSNTQLEDGVRLLAEYEERVQVGCCSVFNRSYYVFITLHRWYSISISLMNVRTVNYSVAEQSIVTIFVIYPFEMRCRRTRSGKWTW